MTDEGETWSDLTALENLMAGRLAMLRRRKAQMKREKVRNGEEERGVTDHAVVRYLERVKGVDIEAVRAELRQLAADATPSKDGDHHWHKSGVILIINDDGSIVTVLSADQVEKWIGRTLADGSKAIVESLSPPTPGTPE